jgi:hypothetical protein
MPRGIPNKQQARKTRVVNTGRRGMREPELSTRLERVKSALAGIDFGFTVFFTDERGESIKHYSGAVVQEEARG